MLDAPGDGIGVPSLGEAVPPGEAAAIAQIVRAIEGRVREAARNGPARRDAHPKMHGCVEAEFRVLDTVPPHLRAGVFARPRRFRAWIRFSNSAAAPAPDSAGDGRGMAIKLLDIARSPSTTQDFVLLNHPAFIVKDAADYMAFHESSPLWRFFAPDFNPFHLRLREALVALRILRKATRNPLSIRYWSVTPYACGGITCKYSARPLPPASPHAAADGPDFLRGNLALHLAEAEARFEFLVQPRADAASMPVEDPRIAWDEAAAPFVPVAEITIPAQRFDTPERDAFGEALSFTPWHCLDAHRPLGGINRVRRTVYEAISRLRHELNGTPRAEPAAAARIRTPA